MDRPLTNRLGEPACASGWGWVSSGYVRGDGNEDRVPRRARLDAVQPVRSTPRYGGNSSCVVAHRGGPCAGDLRSRYRAAPLRRTARLRHTVPRLGAAHAPALGPRAGPAVLPPAAPAASRRSTSTVRARTKGRSAKCSPGLMRPPYFPITPDAARRRRFASTTPATTTSRSVRRRSARVGYATSARRSATASSSNGASVAYISDHGPGCRDDADDFVPQEILELCDGVDVLIHDAQHTCEEYGAEAHWGHCTYDYAVHVARESGAQHARAVPPRSRARRRRGRRDRCVRAADASARVGGPEVIAAAEGLVLARSATHQRDARVTPSPVDMGARTGLGDLPDGPRALRDRGHDRHRARRRRARRHGVQLLHVGLARSSARALLRREELDHVAADADRAAVRRQRARRRRRGRVPRVRDEGRRSLRGRHAPPRPSTGAPSSPTRSRTSTARPKRNTTPATT